MSAHKAFDGSPHKAFTGTPHRAFGPGVSTPPEEVQLSSLMYIDRDPVATTIDDSPDDFTVTLA